MMRIVNERPPVWEAACALWPIADKKVIFCWGDIIYNPNGAVVGPSLVAHEKVHRDRQGDRVEAWWERYLTDARFRLDEEIPAHQAEYDWFKKSLKNRDQIALELLYIAEKLASPIYGNLVSVQRAVGLIRGTSFLPKR